ncbi:hypothetical protein T1E_4597 [Pseudomonas putida DOT-T1E]|uniref:Uncharacterized protein n=1 Tax=Pseudomonas putida (strain DOT-T1E) TaxID=1196325 RepID=I7CEV3_PSEPT|nr:hypothetical protein T1E_4597 [Pseudomonas putida DOT-T1E]
MPGFFLGIFPVPASSRVNPLLQGSCRSGFTREEASTGKYKSLIFKQ